MADAIAAKREARRRRILENSENRLQKITGKSIEPCSEEKVNDEKNQSLLKENGFVSDIIAEKPILNNKHNFLNQTTTITDEDFDFQEFEFPSLSTPYTQQDENFSFDHSIHQRSAKGGENNCDNLNANRIYNKPCKSYYEQEEHSLLHSLIFNSLSNVILAVLVNILLATNIKFIKHYGFITPYFVLAITRLCLRFKSEEPPENSMLVAALILCNINPGIVCRFQQMLSLCSTALKDFALYLTSFVLLNWLISMFWDHANVLQFL